MNAQIPFRMIGSKEKLVDRVVNELETLIISGQLAPEMKLPPERELAEQLGVSRTVVREAVRILVTKGLLETRHGVGTTVSQVSKDQFIQPLNLLLQTSSREISFEHLYQVRLALETAIAGVAASQATEAEIAGLSEILVKMQTAVHDATLLSSRDAEFHRALAHMSHNPLLVVLLDSIRDLLQEYIAMVTPFLDPVQDVLPQHDHIFECVKARDEEGARQAMQQHLDQMRKNHQKYARLTENLCEPLITGENK